VSQIERGLKYPNPSGYCEAYSGTELFSGPA
jgi:hypothetical protein